MKNSFDCTPQQYHAGLDTLWAALPELKGPQEMDVYTLTAEEITRLRAENELLRTFIQIDYDQYEEHHPYARELLRTYPWLADAAVAAEEEQ